MHGYLGGKPADPATLNRDPEIANAADVVGKLGTAMCVRDATEDHEDEHDGEGGMHLTGWSVADDLHEHVKVLDDVQSAGRGEWG